MTIFVMLVALMAVPAACVSIVYCVLTMREWRIIRKGGRT